MPSSTYRLLRVCAPLIAGNEKAPIVLPAHPPPPPLLWSLLMLTAPGVMVSNWVKLRPFSGSSTTSRLLTTEPNSEVEDSTAAAVASTVTVDFGFPTFRGKEEVAGWVSSRGVLGCAL